MDWRRRKEFVDREFLRFRYGRNRFDPLHSTPLLPLLVLFLRRVSCVVCPVLCCCIICLGHLVSFWSCSASKCRSDSVGNSSLFGVNIEGCGGSECDDWCEDGDLGVYCGCYQSSSAFSTKVINPGLPLRLRLKLTTQLVGKIALHSRVRLPLMHSVVSLQ